MPDLAVKFPNYDLHLVIVFMSLAAAVICMVGVGGTLLFESNGFNLKMINIRADSLGDYLNSTFALIYNLSLLAAGSCIILAMLAIYFTFTDRLSRSIAIVGAAVGLCIILMGVFPINILEWHRRVSTLYLICTLVLHCLCVVDFFKPKGTMSKGVFGLSLIAIASATVMLFLLDWTTYDFPPCEHLDNSICVVSLSMWILTQSTILWCVGLGLEMRKVIIDKQRLHLLSPLQSARKTPPSTLL